MESSSERGSKESSQLSDGGAALQVCVLVCVKIGTQLKAVEMLPFPELFAGLNFKNECFTLSVFPQINAASSLLAFYVLDAVLCP